MTSPTTPPTTAPSPLPTTLELHAPDGVPEVAAGDDLAGLLLAALDLRDGDVLLVTSKVVSKAEGRLREGDREEALAEETVRVVARRGPTTIVRTRLGLTMAAAGIDASNVPVGRIALLPLDPDGSARRLREEVRRRTGHNVAVVVTDTAGRAWREGQTDIAVGAAGLPVAQSYAGRTDEHGNELAVTLPAVADELAGAAELVAGKLGGRPFTLARGLPGLVLPPDDHGPGASALVRPEGGDLFGYGAREAVVRALRGDPGDQPPFGEPAALEELLDALDRVGRGAWLPSPTTPGETSYRLVHEVADPAAGPAVTEEVVAAACFAFGWRLESWQPVATGVEVRVSAPAAPTTP